MSTANPIPFAEAPIGIQRSKLREILSMATGRQIEDAADNAPRVWVAGGAIRSLIEGKRVRDWDLFSWEPWTVIETLDRECDNSPLMHYLGENHRTKTYRHDDFGIIQVVHGIAFSTMKDTIEMFDFTICAAACDGNWLVINERYFMDLAQRRLVVQSLPAPLGTIRRALKFAGKGYKLCPTGLARILKEINKMEIDWDDPNQNEIEFWPDGTIYFPGID